MNVLLSQGLQEKRGEHRMHKTLKSHIRKIIKVMREGSWGVYPWLIWGMRINGSHTMEIDTYAE